MLRFESFEVSLRAREVRKHGLKLKVHGASFEVLRALLERPGELVTREELRERLWPAGTYVDYDNSLNSTVNRLREALHDSAEKPRYIETLPRLGYRFIAQVERSDSDAEAPAQNAANAWPPGARSIPANQNLGFRTRQPQRAISLAFLGLLCLLALYFGWRSWPPPAQPPPQNLTLAVLPFQVPGAESKPGLGLLIAHDLIRQISRSPGIKVLPLSAGYRYLSHPGKIPQAANDLGAAILSGTAIEDGDRVHLQVQLTGPPAQGRRPWTHSISMAKAHLFRANDALAEEVRRELLGNRAGLALSAAARPPSLEAYEDLLEGIFHLDQRTSVGISRAMDAFELAVQKDPKFAAPYAGLAVAQSFDMHKWREAERNARRALDLDPRSSEAHTALGFIRLFWQRDWEAARDEFKTALDLNPGNPTAHHWYALYFATHGYFDQALPEIEHAQRLDPYSPAILADLGHILILAQHHERAAEACRQALTLAPDFLNAHACLYKIYRQTGMTEQAAAKRAEIRNRLGRQLIAYPEGYDLAEDLALDGQLENSMRMLQSAYARSELSIVFLRANPVFRKLHHHPAYRTLLKHLSLDSDFVPYTPGPS